MLRCMLIGMGIGIAAEIVARAFSLWVYHQPQTPLLNILAMFGLIMGGVASLVPKVGMPGAFAAGAAIGLVYEIANLRVLKWWYFPNERLLFIPGHTAIVVLLALLWGAVPVAIATAQSKTPHSRPAATPVQSAQSRLDELNAREKQLIEKLEAVRQRERDLESRLEDIRRRKQVLIDKQTARHPPTAATPSP